MDKDRIVGSAKDIAGKVEGAVGDATDDAKTQASGRAREATGTVQNLYGQAKDAVRNVGDAATSYAKDAYENARSTTQEWKNNVQGYVQREPVKALLIAAGVGALLGILWKRR